ncbi:MAG: hypothetical protein LAP13_01265 [Acidobacteriia bacterium]|nr:hypothetical protein [Terriglobia bacterium]
MKEHPRTALVLLVIVCCPWITASLRGEVRQTVFLVPGTPAEASAVMEDFGSSVERGARRATAGGGWTYRVVVPPQAECTLTFDAEGATEVTVTSSDAKPVTTRMEKDGTKYTLHATIPSNHPLGGELRFQFRARGGPISVCQVKLTLALPDRHGDGVSDAVETMMGLRSGERCTVIPRPDEPHTGFFFAEPCDPRMAVPADAVQLYLWTPATDFNVYSSWAEKGFKTQTFLHSRYGREIRDRAEENQTDRNGNPLVVMEVKRDGNPIDMAVGALTRELKAAMVKRHGDGISIEATDYYKVPTQARIDVATQYYTRPLDAGATGFCFDEPEIWAQAGYSEAFKQEWKARYGMPWEPPHRSVDARYKSEQLKAFLMRRWVEEILTAVQQRKPSATRMLAMHSPINYYLIRMATPHHSLVDIPALQEVVAEVWNQPFEVGYLEYSSFYQLVRGTRRRLWFMMDPWGDSPAMSLDFYRHSYGDNVLAALMYPQVDTFEPLIWPNRIYGHVPKEYETLINTVTGALSEFWRYPRGEVEAGSRGIGTFIADSMGWQRAEPSPSDFDGFFGLSRPLVRQGVPVDVLSLDRVTEPGYLESAKVLLASYDFLKPTDASQNRALADWTRRGGTLVFFGGTDAYNAVSESWWRRIGLASPGEALFAQMGLPIQAAKVLSNPGRDACLDATSPEFDSNLARLCVPLGPSSGEEDYRRELSLGHLLEEATSREPRRTYPVTLYKPPPGGRSLYRMEGESVPAVWEASVGKGTAVYVGVEPGFLNTDPGSRWLRMLVKYALGKAGENYREQPYFLVRRGPYMAIRTLDKAYKVQGRFVDLFSPSLRVVENYTIPARECAFLAEAGRPVGAPRILAVSGRLRAYYQGAQITSFLAQAPSQTEGAARIWAGQRRPKNVKAFTVLGASVPITSHTEGDSVLLQFPNDADGVVVRVEWEPEKVSSRTIPAPSKWSFPSLKLLSCSSKESPSSSTKPRSDCY